MNERVWEEMRERAAEDAEAVAWVREHGGIEALRRMFQDADNRRVELCGALGVDLDKGWSEAMAAMRLRLVPKGMEWLVEAWPRFEDDAPLVRGDEVMTSDGVVKAEGLSLTICDEDGGVTSIDFGERVKRPAPKVLDADGVEIRVGDTVYEVDTGEQMWVCALPKQGEYSCVKLRLANGMSTALDPFRLTHRAPVLAADGKPLREGETVWGVDSGTRYTVEKITDELIPIKCRSEMGSTVSLYPSQLTHERPVADTWERLEEDAANLDEMPCDYSAKDLVRRAKALAERGA